MGRQSGVAWAVGVFAPWCLGVGLLVSFTADAGQETGDDLYMAPLTARTLATRSGANAIGSPLSGDIGIYGQSAPRIQAARLSVGRPEDLRNVPDEREPRVDLKPEVAYFPEVDRTKKGDPIVNIRPTFDTRLKSLGAKSDLAFRLDGDATLITLAPRSALPGDEALSDASDALAEDPQATTQRGNAIASPAQSSSAPTARASGPPQDDRIVHGATPSVSRAVALGSSTPAQPDAVPIEVAAFPQATIAIAPPDKGMANKTLDSARPDYAALIDQGKMDRERRCLAEAVYFEARSEPREGQAAVAQVVLNRVSSGLYPTTVCGVVYQNRHHYHGCQFSFACEGKSLRITEQESWTTAVRIANEVMDGHTYLSDVGRSTHYHANYVKPRWARRLKRMDVIGHHIFYRLKPGQT
jgi:spore germination cell wall hydrolase CwlJ-like protein